MSEPVARHGEEEVLGKAYDGRLMRRLLGYVRPYGDMVIGSLALILFSALMQLLAPLATAVALDLFIRPAGAGRIAAPSAFLRDLLLAQGIDPASIAVPGLTAIAVLYLVILGITLCTAYAQGYVLQVMGQYIMNDLRRQIFGRLQRLPLGFYDKNPIGRLVTRVTTDVDALNEMFTAGIVTIFGDLVLLFGIVIMLFWLDWRLALVAFSIVPLLFGLTTWFRLRVRHSFREVRVKIARINAFLQEHITGMPVVQLFNREARAYDEFTAINAEHRDVGVRSIFYYALFFPGVELISAIGVGLLIWIGGGRVVQGAISVGALIAFLQYAQRFYQPLSDLSDKYNILQAAMASSERIFRLIDTPVTISTPPDAYRPALSGQAEGDIQFDDVRFSYNPGEPVLKGISFRVRPGEALAVVGHTGAGKSTLASLLLRFYDVDSGAVRVDGIDVREWDLPRLRRSVAMVLQDVFLFSGSIGNNIRLGEEAIDDERVRWAAREVHADSFIEKLPGGFAAAVRERGAGLSVGQKQLIAFARALAFDPRILILDEATSSIDTETEQLIQKALDRLLEGRTSIVIAHRLSTIQKAEPHPRPPQGRDP